LLHRRNHLETIARICGGSGEREVRFLDRNDRLRPDKEDVKMAVRRRGCVELIELAKVVNSEGEAHEFWPSSTIEAAQKRPNKSSKAEVT
jgi:predicted ATP-dependent Lon-type protease